jgi:DNA-binding LacI/PurR family transcriptional regulator
MMTLRTQTQLAIAQRLGISASTVSLALRDAPQIAKETRLRVRQIAEELGYEMRPRRKAKATSLSVEVKQVSFLTTWEPTNPFYSAVLNGAAAACRHHGIALQYNLLTPDLEETLQQLAGVDAVLAVGAINEAMLRRVTALDQPVVLVDNNVPHLGVDRVLTENVGGVYTAVLRLAAIGHRRIAFLRGLDTYSSMRERLRGYHEALAALGLAAIEIPCTSRKGKDSLTAWLNKHGAPDWTALLVYNDEAAIEALHVLHDHGVRVPDDVSLVGFDDIDVAQLVRPMIATCRVPREQMGETAVRMLLTRLQDPNAPTQAIVLDTVFIARDSIRPHNG